MRNWFLILALLLPFAAVAGPGQSNEGRTTEVSAETVSPPAEASSIKAQAVDLIARALFASARGFMQERADNIDAGFVQLIELETKDLLKDLGQPPSKETLKTVSEALMLWDVERALDPSALAEWAQVLGVSPQALEAGQKRLADLIAHEAHFRLQAGLSVNSLAALRKDLEGRWDNLPWSSDLASFVRNAETRYLRSYLDQIAKIAAAAPSRSVQPQDMVLSHLLDFVLASFKISGLNAPFEPVQRRNVLTQVIRSVRDLSRTAFSRVPWSRPSVASRAGTKMFQLAGLLGFGKLVERRTSPSQSAELKRVLDGFLTSAPRDLKFQVGQVECRAAGIAQAFRGVLEGCPALWAKMADQKSDGRGASVCESKSD